MNRLEGLILTGGASRRMGVDKATLLVEGIPLAQRVAEEIASVCEPVTVLGREPVDGFRFVRDPEAYGGPLVAMAAFLPTQPFVFVSSCDLPCFSGQVIQELAGALGDADAAVPILEGRRQPLCALYRAEAFHSLRVLVSEGERRVMRWLDQLQVAEVTLSDSRWAASANTPEELARLLGRGSPG